MILKRGADRMYTEKGFIEEHGDNTETSFMNSSTIELTDSKKLYRLNFDEIINKDSLKKIDSRDVILSGIIHDFNNIISSILCNVAVAKTQLDKKEKVKCILERVEKASRQASNLCKHLTYFGKSEASFQKEDCHHITTLIEDLTEFILNGSNVKFRIHSSDNLWFIKIDESEFSVILTNLLLNAKQAMNNDGKINIYLKNMTIRNSNGSLPSGNYVKISVEDSGAGISKQNLSKIFEPYFTTKQNGKGLGLLTTYSIIKKYDGYIDLETEPGVGTTFNIYFPAVQ